ncbi:MAG: PD40 domain-containing protein [Bacteroidetes bacterium]|nr:PD40 domain-containing protein [Bacteroidota bacterium]
MEVKYLLIIFLVVIASVSLGQDTIYDKSFKNKALELTGGKIALSKGNEAFRVGNYKVAIVHYTEVLRFSSDNQKVFYKLAQCNLNLKKYEESLNYFKKVVVIDDQRYNQYMFLKGNAYRGMGNLVKAIDAYKDFEIQLENEKVDQLNKKKEKLVKKKEKAIEKYDVDKKEELEKVNAEEKVGNESYQFQLNRVRRYIAQCERAQDMMAHPVDVKIKNAGNNLNSKYDDYSPSITGDGKTMILTSRRADTKGGRIYLPDGKYFSDIYISTYNDSTNTWSKALSIPGKINTENFDASLSISSDGKQIFIYSSGSGAGDIVFSEKNDNNRWGSPKPVDENKLIRKKKKGQSKDDVKKVFINSSYYESSATVTADGKTMYFISERPGGQGNGDIYKVEKRYDDSWGEPVNLGEVVNTEFDEISVFIHPNGKTLFFSSEGHTTMGGKDIFKSELKDGEWTKPVNLGYPINTIKDDIHFIIRPDNRKAYYSCEKEGGFGGRDIYEIDLSNHPSFK